MKRTSGRAIEAWIWTMAVAWAVGWHAIWLVTVPPARAIPAGAPRRTPRLTWLRTAGTCAPIDSGEEVGSPVVFALPTRWGFSSRVAAQVTAVPPPLSPLPTWDLLATRSRRPPSPADRREPPLSAWAERRLSLCPTAWQGEPAFPHGVAGPSKGLDVSWFGDLAASDFVRAEFPTSGLVRSLPWEARVYVEVNEAGCVSRALLEKPTEDPSLDETLVRAVRRWVPRPGVRSRSGVVTIRGPGATLAEE